MRHINRGPFLGHPFPLPPRPEQDRIVAEIEKQFTRLDAGVEALMRLQAHLRRYRAAVLKAACEGTLITSRGGARARGAGYFEVPDTWRWVTVRDVGEVKLGRQRAPQHHSGKHMRPYLRVANVYDARIDLSDVMQMNFTPEEFNTFKLRNGDVLLNEGQSLEWIGRAAIFRGEPEGACFQNTLVRFRARDGLLPAFALLVFRHYLYSQRFQRIARWTTNIAHLGAERFALMPFPLPPLAEQRQIVDEAESGLSDVAAAEDTLKTSLARAARLRASVLQRAFGGTLVD